VLDILDHPAESARQLQEHGPRLLAAPDLASLGEALLDVLETELFCRAGALWSVTPGGSLRPVARRHAEGHQVTRSRTLSVGGRVVGRLDVDGTVIAEGSAGDGHLDTLLPWLSVALAARLETGGRGDSLSERARALGLTAREVEVLGWIREGKSNPEIAQILSISPRTVHKHVEHLLQKLGAETRHAAACQALLWRWDEGPTRGKPAR
jgi:DNA-binding CsgD family transcriptional regulator